jgi:hypothetical protein
MGGAPHAQPVNAITDAMATGYRVIAVIVRIAAVAITQGLRREQVPSIGVCPTPDAGDGKSRAEL